MLFNDFPKDERGDRFESNKIGWFSRQLGRLLFWLNPRALVLCRNENISVAIAVIFESAADLQDAMKENKQEKTSEPEQELE